TEAVGHPGLYLVLLVRIKETGRKDFVSTRAEKDVDEPQVGDEQGLSASRHDAQTPYWCRMTVSEKRRIDEVGIKLCDPRGRPWQKAQQRNRDWYSYAGEKDGQAVYFVSDFIGRVVAESVALWYINIVWYHGGVVEKD